MYSLCVVFLICDDANMLRRRHWLGKSSASPNPGAEFPSKAALSAAL
jgi:hypothetical protein